MKESIVYFGHIMAVRDEDLEKVGAYVEAKLPQWVERTSYEAGQNWLFHANRPLFMELNTAVQLV